MSNEKSALGKISSSLETLKVLGDPYIYKQALAIEQGVKEMVAMDSPLVEQYGESMKKFDTSMIAKYGLRAARFAEFGLLAYVAFKLFV